MSVTRLKWCLLALAAFACCVFALHSFLNSRYAQDWALAQIRAKVAAQALEVDLGNRASVDWIGRVRLGPLTILYQGRPILRADSATVRLAYGPLLVGRLVPAATTLHQVEIDLGRAREAVKHLIGDLNPKGSETKQPSERIPVDFHISADEIRVLDSHPTLNKCLRLFTPLSGQLAFRRTTGRWSARGDLSFNRDGHLLFDAAINRDRPATLAITLDAPHVEELFDRVGNLPVSAKGGQFHSQLALSSGNFRQAQISYSASLRNFLVDGQKLDSDVIGPLGLTSQGTFNWDRSSGRISVVKIENGISDYAPVPVEVEGWLDLGPPANIDIEIALRKVSFQRLLQALPPQLSPGADVPAMTGALSGEFRLMGPASKAEKLDLTAKLDLSGLHPLQNSPIPLTTEFEYRPLGDFSVPVIVVGPKNPNFVPLETVPQFLIGAVLLSEDAGFWGHRGFDFQEIKGSMLEAVEGRVRGASTITQQLAKNLYYSREKTYARKIREAIATVALEASLPKSRILEIYLNIIEWGPGIFGLGQAAQHYFGCQASALTPKQAAYLATIIPNPIKYYTYYRHGALTEVWEKRVHDLLLKMKDRGVLSDEEFLEADETSITFASADPRN